MSDFLRRLLDHPIRPVSTTMPTFARLKKAPEEDAPEKILKAQYTFDLKDLDRMRHQALRDLDDIRQQKVKAAHQAFEANRDPTVAYSGPHLVQRDGGCFME